MSKKGTWTGERLETDIYTQDAIDHLHRYAIVQQYIKGKTVLDIASGEGYGSSLMAASAFHVIGVDIDPESIANATAKYKAQNLDFIHGSADKIPVSDASIDVLISFETLEHHDLHNEMFREIKRVLKPEGLVIISTPDKKYYSDARNFKNKFHVKELYEPEFRALSQRFFSNLQCLSQTYINGSSLIQDIDKTAAIKFFTGNFSKVEPIHPNHLYLIVLGSDSDFVHVESSIFSGEEISRLEISKIISETKNSASFKLGNAFLRPFRFLRKIKN